MAVELIAELATNFGSDIELGKRFIRTFASAGVDTVKIQVFNHEHLNPKDPQYEWFRYCQLRDGYRELRDEAGRLGVKFLATAYHPDDVATVAALGCDRIKVGSGEGSSLALATAIRKSGIRKVIVSAGLGDVWEMTSLRHYGLDVKVLGCVTRYPAPGGIAYATLTGEHGLHGFSGWSDHSVGLDECKAAIVAGASIVEFHVQLPGQARPARPFEKTADEVHELRLFADDNPHERYLGRWNYGQ